MAHSWLQGLASHSLTSVQIQARGSFTSPCTEAKGSLDRLWFTFAASTILGQFEASGAAALVGPLRVLTLVAAQASGIMPALVDI